MGLRRFFGSVLLAEVLSTPPQLVPSFPDLITRAFALASQAQIGVYDCLYVALAEREGCDFITAETVWCAHSRDNSPSFCLLLRSLDS